MGTCKTGESLMPIVVTKGAFKNTVDCFNDEITDLKSKNEEQEAENKMQNNYIYSDMIEDILRVNHSPDEVDQLTADILYEKGRKLAEIFHKAYIKRHGEDITDKVHTKFLKGFFEKINALVAKGDKNGLKIMRDFATLKDNPSEASLYMQVGEHADPVVLAFVSTYFESMKELPKGEKRNESDFLEALKKNRIHGYKALLKNTSAIFEEFEDKGGQKELKGLSKTDFALFMSSLHTLLESYNRESNPEFFGVDGKAKMESKEYSSIGVIFKRLKSTAFHKSNSLPVVQARQLVTFLNDIFLYGDTSEYENYNHNLSTNQKYKTIWCASLFDIDIRKGSGEQDAYEAMKKLAGQLKGNGRSGNSTK